MRVIVNPQTEAPPVAVARPPPEPSRPTKAAPAWLAKHAGFVNEVYSLILEYIQSRTFPDGQVLELDSNALRDAVKEYVFSCSAVGSRS